MAKNKIAPEVFVIVNPKSAGGRTVQTWKDKYEPEFIRAFQEWEVAFTEKSGHASELAAQAIKRGVKKIIAVGGDGTIHEVTQGFFRSDGKPRVKPGSDGPHLGIISAGTGSDFVKTLHLPSSPAELVRVIKNGHTKTIDAGRLEYRDFQGEPAKSMFINIAEVGIGGDVCKTINASGKGGFLAYQWYSFTTLLKFQPQAVKIKMDGREMEQRATGVIVANGRYFGGGMKVAPAAQVDDGIFDVIILDDMPRFEMILKMGKIKTGSHINEKGVRIFQAKEVVVEAADNATFLLDADGESPGHCPVKFKIVPASMSVIVP